MRKPIVVEKQFLIMGLLCFACSCGTGGKKVVPDKAGATVIALTDSVRTDTVDLGRIHAGEVIRRDLSLRNGSDRPMIILSAATNCGCPPVEFEREPVQPGAEAGFVFEFDSKGFSGYQLKHITLRTPLSKQPFTLVVIGEVE